MNDTGKTLFLGPANSLLLAWLKDQDRDVIQFWDRISTDFIEEHEVTFLISCGYRHIISGEILERLAGAAVNLHISFLPWNRGADPNFWSFLDGTPKGVSIHYIDKGIDTGDLIVQQQCRFGPGETLRTTYEKLQDKIQSLFKQRWKEIEGGDCPRRPQTEPGSYHRTKDLKAYEFLLADGWDTPVDIIEEYGKRSRIRDKAHAETDY